MRTSFLALTGIFLATTVSDVAARIAGRRSQSSSIIAEEETVTYIGGIHPITSMDDPRLRNPWAGVASPHHKKRRELNNATRQRQPNPGPPGDAPSTVYDAIIVGAGPGGCSAAHTLVDRGVDPTKILVLERGPSLDEYKSRGYDNALQYGVAQADADFREDIAGTPITLGTGVGGGTNHFGMQYIDQPEVSDASSRQPVAGSNIKADVDKFSSFSQATTYSDSDYISAGVAANYNDLTMKINEVLGNDGKAYRNKVYKTQGASLSIQPRLLVGDLIDTNVNVRHGTEVVSLVAGRSGEPHCVRLQDGSRECAKHVLLAANPLNSGRLALNSGIVPHTGRDQGRKYLGGLWDHHGMVISYLQPGTTFVEVPPTPISDANRAGLDVYASMEEAEGNNTGTGFIAYVTVPVLNQDQVNKLTTNPSTWSGNDPTGDELLSYLFDMGSFFSAVGPGSHPGGNKEQDIINNDYDIGRVLDNLAPDSHKGNDKIRRLTAAGGKLLGILDKSTSSFVPSYASSTGGLGASNIIGHIQSRPNDHAWQYYFVTIPTVGHNGTTGEIMVGVSTTGEAIEDDGRVYAGAAVTADTVRLPSFRQAGFEAVKDGLEKNDQILQDLGWIPLASIPATLEDMVNDPSFLASTYHYHVTLCPSTTNITPGFHACDLSRMCRKWAGSTSVASGAMGVQCGNEVADSLSN